MRKMSVRSKLQTKLIPDLAEIVMGYAERNVWRFDPWYVVTLKWDVYNMNPVDGRPSKILEGPLSQVLWKCYKHHHLFAKNPIYHDYDEEVLESDLADERMALLNKFHNTRHHLRSVIRLRKSAWM